MDREAENINVLLLGKDGQVGSALKVLLPTLTNLTAIGRSELDLMHTFSLHKFLEQKHPHIIINAAAYTNVDAAENDKETAFLINEHVVSVLSQYALKNDALLIHYSTDYVFDGEKSTPYLETDIANPQNIYGASKYAGEQAIVNSGCEYFIFRTSWVYSATGKNFVKTILKLAKTKEFLSVVADQRGIPTPATLIAEVTALTIERYLKQNIEPGLYHLAASGSTDWYEFACKILDIASTFDPSLKLTRNKICPITSQEYCSSVKRPMNSILHNHALTKALALPFPDWSTYLLPIIRQLT
jgi:dTDP-4-dehydrorhamnose reductase